MHAWETIEHSLDYIDEHLGEEVKIEELAGMAALSPFYFQRLFKRLVHKPVQEYVKLRRLAKAVEALRDPRLWTTAFPATPISRGPSKTPTQLPRKSIGRRSLCSTLLTARRSLPTMC